MRQKIKLSLITMDMWRAAAAFVPVNDLKKWHEEKSMENSPYAWDIFSCGGGKTPEENPEEFELRSPIFHLKGLSDANLKIFHGKYDPVVPVFHSMELYQRMLKQSPGIKNFSGNF